MNGDNRQVTFPAIAAQNMIYRRVIYLFPDEDGLVWRQILKKLRELNGYLPVQGGFSG